jgi:hypothetical protein
MATQSGGFSRGARSLLPSKRRAAGRAPRPLSRARRAPHGAPALQGASRLRFSLSVVARYVIIVPAQAAIDANRQLLVVLHAMARYAFFTADEGNGMELLCAARLSRSCACSAEIYKEGDFDEQHSSSFFIVISGDVILNSTGVCTPTHRASRTWHARTAADIPQARMASVGGTFGLLETMLDVPRMATATALRDVVLLGAQTGARAPCRPLVAADGGSAHQSSHTRISPRSPS